MADETISTRIVANADFSALIADVHKVTASLSRLQEQLAGSNKMLANQIAVMNRSFSDTMRSTGQFSTHFVSLQSDVEKFGKNLDGGKLKLNQYFNAFRDQARTSGGLIRDLAKQQVSLQNAVLQPLGRNAQGLMQFNVHVPRGLDTIKNKTAIARTELQIMNKVIQDGAGQLINWGKNTQWAGRQLTVGLTVPLAAFGKAAADAFRQADAELVRLTKVYGDVAGTSAAELGKVRNDVVQTAKEISAAMGVSFKETIGLAADIAATGKTGDELLGSIKETTRLAVLGEVDRQEAMKATLAIQSAFKQNTDELSESINFLNAVENQTSTTLNDLVEAIPKAGPVIKGLGGDVQDLALYLTAMREGGINASEGANALKSALASLINPTDVAVGKFKTLGIDLLGVVNNNAGDLTGTLMALQGALDNLDPLQKQQAIEQLFGKFQFARLNALFENLGKQGSQTLQVMDLMKASSDELAAVAGRELTAVTESASGRYNRALESLKASLAGVGEQFLTINTYIIQTIDKVIQFATSLPKPVKQILTLLGGITAVAGPLIMITGLLANFFGYMAKGIFHLKAFFKGGEGFKYLTPEMLAAEKAGKLVEQSFYSDAKAAAVLKQALGNLIDEFSLLEAKAKSGAMSVNPAVSTMAGNLVVAAGGGRVVDPNHPLAGPMGTRASSHMVPRAGMTEEQRLQQTMFGMVPGSGPVNQKIGQNPQIYMNDNLPDVPGLTKVNGVSTGIVAGEAARHHAMMATLAMQSKEEINEMKKQMVATGTISKDLMLQFDGMLPVVSRLTDNAAKQSAMIVAELRAGTLNVEQARAKIIALNLETERMIAAAASAQAGTLGRTINPTMIPTLNQPVVDPTGKSNMRELFKKGSTRDFINRVAGAMGVRTSGAGYNIETTKPRRLAMGAVGVQKYAGGYTSLAAGIKAAKMLRAFSKQSSMVGGLRKVGSRSNRVGAEAGVDKSFGEIYRRGSGIYKDPEFKAYGISPTSGDDYLVHAMTPGFRRRTSGLASQGSSAVLSRDKYSEFNLQMDPKTLANNSSLQLLPTQFIKNTRAFNTALSRGGNAAASFRPVAGEDMVSLLMFLKSQGVKPAAAKVIADRAAQVLNHKISTHRGTITEDVFGKLLNNASVRAIQSGAKPNMIADRNVFGSDAFSRNRGLKGIDLKENTPMGVPGFAGGVTNLSGYGGGDIIPALLEPGESVITKTATKGNAGTLALMNQGFPVDRILGFQDGVVGATGALGSMRQGYAAKRATAGQVSQGSPTGGMGAFMGGMALQMGGNAVGGTAGQIMSMAGMGMQMLPLIGMLKGVVGGVTKLSGGFRLLGSVGGTAINVLSKLKMINPYMLAGTVVLGGLIAAFKKWRKEIEETRREQTNTFGITTKGAKEAGIQYTSLTDKVKALREEQKLAADKAKAYFESYTTSGVRGLTLTIQQLRELKERVKNDMPELISTFNSIDTSKVNDLASNLKAQMIASGKSVEEATNLIYALIEASDKAGMGVGAISSKAFAGISDQGTAASFILQNLAKNIQDVSKIDPSAFASNVDTAISSLDSAVSALIGTKDESGKVLDEAAAIAVQFERMTAAGVKNNKLGEETLNTLKSQRPEFANILNKADTIGGMYAKWRLMLQGVSIDLSRLSSAQAETLAAFTAGLDAAGAAALTVGGGVAGLEEAAGTLKELKKQYEAANKASNSNSISAAGLSKKQIKAIQDEIKAIRERAEAKKRALRETFDRENAELELQQAKLDLQNAIARGDNEAAAAAQIRIQQIQKEASLKAAEARIDENARKAEEKQQAILDKDQQYKDRLTEGVTAAGNRAGRIGETIKTVTELGDELTRVAKLRVLSDAKGATQKQKDDFSIAFSNVLNDIAKAANSSPEVAKAYADFLRKDAQGKFVPLASNEAKTVAMKRSGNTINMPQGDALTQLDQLASSMGDFAIKITGGKTLSNIYDILAKGQPKQSTITFKSDAEMKDVIAKNAGKSSVQYKTPYDKDGYLTEAARNSIIVSKKLVAGDTFTDPNGVQYNVKNGYDSKLGGPRAVRKAMGGYISRAANGISGMTGSQPYLVGERGPELFVPSSGGQIIPNNKLGASYHIPSGGINSVKGSANNSYNNNVYNIDIQLSGTNVTADDIMRKFKSELALVNAKEGRSRSFGGNY
jgi:TP901 family phage tail tape measure protein